jgi:hypothetical protein
MNPEEAAKAEAPKTNAPAPIAEPPKSLQFTEVPSENAMPAAHALPPVPVVEHKPEAEKPAEPPKEPAKEPEKPPLDPNAKGIEPSVQPAKPAPAKSAKNKGPQKPILMLTMTVVLFLVLAAVAYLAYTKSQ